MDDSGIHECDADALDLAQIMVADQGFNAEAWIIRQAATFEREGNREDAVKLGFVLEHVAALRLRAGIRYPVSAH